MASDRKLTVSYALKVPAGVEPPVDPESKSKIPSEATISFSCVDSSSSEKTLDYKGVLAAIQQAKEATGQNIFTPWRDAVGDREKGKDAKKPSAANESDEEEEGAEPA